MIPIYRAKKIDIDEWVEGYLRENSEISPFKYYIQLQKGYFSEKIEIDPNTLAIHFPNMIDKNGKKIFASLGEDGIGGDEFKITYYGTTCPIELKDTGFFVFDGWEYNLNHGSYGIRNYCKDLHNKIYKLEVIGIHKG